MRSGKGLRLGVAFTAAALTIVFATVLVHRTDPDSPSAPTAGGVTLGGADLAPASPGQRTDLVVRALGIGAAVARRQVMAVLEEAEGVIAPESASLGEGVIMARVSREKLMFVMRTLARKGPYKVVKSDDRKLDGDDISIRFELE